MYPYNQFGLVAGCAKTDPLGMNIYSPVDK